MGDKEPLDVYCDQFSMSSSTWGVGLSFGVAPIQPPTGEPPIARTQTTVRMGTSHAKAVATIMHKQLKDWERKFSKIQLPDEIYESLQLSPDGW